MNPGQQFPATPGVQLPPPSVSAQKSSSAAWKLHDPVKVAITTTATVRTALSTGALLRMLVMESPLAGGVSLILAKRPA
jgi:hypothetical protein